MSDLISHRDWLKLTDGGLTSIRSSELKAIDAALKTYETAPTAPNRDAIMRALVRWFQKEGPNWKNSVRNKRNAVDTLHRQLIGDTGPTKTGEGMIALSTRATNPAQSCMIFFRGRSSSIAPAYGTKSPARACSEKSARR